MTASTTRFGLVGVAAIEITGGELAVGDTIHIKGHTTDCTTRVESMQLEHEKITRASKGQAVGISLREKVRVHDKVYKVTD